MSTGYSVDVVNDTGDDLTFALFVTAPDEAPFPSSPLVWQTHPVARGDRWTFAWGDRGEVAYHVGAGPFAPGEVVDPARFDVDRRPLPFGDGVAALVATLAPGSHWHVAPAGTLAPAGPKEGTAWPPPTRSR